MNTSIAKLYAKFRKNPSMIHVGRNAECALRCARTIARFTELERDGRVRLRDEPEQENYFSVYGEPDTKRERKEILDLIERWGCVYVLSEWFDGEDWIQADAIGMCIYEKPLSPFENCYVPQLMDAAIEALEAHQAEHAETQYAEIFP